MSFVCCHPALFPDHFSVNENRTENDVSAFRQKYFSAGPERRTAMKYNQRISSFRPSFVPLFMRSMLSRFRCCFLFSIYVLDCPLKAEKRRGGGIHLTVMTSVFLLLERQSVAPPKLRWNNPLGWQQWAQMIKLRSWTTTVNLNCLSCVGIKRLS